MYTKLVGFDIGSNGDFTKGQLVKNFLSKIAKQLIDLAYHESFWIIIAILHWLMLLRL